MSLIRQTTIPIATEAIKIKVINEPATKAHPFL
jgi:hypothetical protein